MLIDTGCSISLISAACSRGLCVHKESVKLQTVNCDFVETTGFVILQNVTIEDGSKVNEVRNVKAYVLPSMPLDVDMIVGLDVVMREGLTVKKSQDGSVLLELGCFGKEVDKIEDVPLNDKVAHEINDEDLRIEFVEQKWIVKWKWNNCSPPLNNKRCNYKVPEEQRNAFDGEIQQWIDEGILVPWERNRDGELQNVLPLMSVKQEKGNTTKIRPVLDFRFLNDYIVSKPASATPLCQDRLREWRQSSPNFAIVDLRKAYLQIMIDPSL